MLTLRSPIVNNIMQDEVFRICLSGTWRDPENNYESSYIDLHLSKMKWDEREQEFAARVVNHYPWPIEVTHCGILRNTGGKLNIVESRVLPVAITLRPMDALPVRYKPRLINTKKCIILPCLHERVRQYQMDN
jgi:hypothetical protein